MATRLKGVPVIVGSNRYQAGQKAILAFDADIILLDDAFQHIRLDRDLNLCLCDAKKPFGNGYLVPRGLLREPVEHLGRADAVVLTRHNGSKGLPKSSRNIQKYIHGEPVFRCSHTPSGLREPASSKTHDVEILKGRKILAFSGIAKNDNFAAMLSKLGSNIVKFIPFPDHHRRDDRQPYDVYPL